MAQVCYVPEAFLPFTPAYLLQLSAEERRAVVSDLRQAWELYRAANDAFASEYALSAGELHGRFLSSVVQSYEEKARNGSSRVRRRSEEMGDLPAAKRARSYNKLADAEASDLELHDNDSDNDNDDSDPDSAHGAEGYDHSSETPTVSSDSGEAAASYSARPESGASAVPSSSAIVRRRYAEPCGCPSNPLLTLLSKWPCTCSHKSGDSIDAREPMAAGTKSGGCRHHGRDRRYTQVLPLVPAQQLGLTCARVCLMAGHRDIDARPVRYVECLVLGDSSRRSVLTVNYVVRPQAFLSRVRRTLGTRFYLLQLGVEERTSDTADWRFEVLDRSQDDQTLCYHTVTIGLVPSCNCPNSAKGVNCEHILFVLLYELLPLSLPSRLLSLE